MKLFRYRKPSLRTMLGYTTAVRRVKRRLGISQVQRWTSASRIKQRAKQRLGVYSPVVRALRNTAKGRFPTILGLGSRRR